MQRNQRLNCQHSLDHRKREFQKNIHFCFIEYTKAFDCVDHNKLWKILKLMRIPDHLSCPLRNLYAGQEATVSTTHRLITSWERSTLRLYIVTLLINLHAEYILRNTRMDEAQVGIKIARRNINNLR